MPVRYPEGVVHGFLTLSSVADDSTTSETLARGDLLQTVSGATVESRMLLLFRDGSRHDERAAFTQREVLRLTGYRLIQEGPSFPVQIDATIDVVTGAYRVRSRELDGGELEDARDTLDVPGDLYNGMMPIVTKNIEGRGRRVHVVAFMPEPELVEVAIRSAAEDSVALGGAPQPLAHYLLSPRLGPLKEAVATLLGRNPPDNHMWIVTGEAPGFVRFRGPLYVEGPVWQIDVAAPRWPK